MVVNKTCFSRNERWDKALTSRAKLLFGSAWEYNPEKVLAKKSHWGGCLTTEVGENRLSWRYDEDKKMALWSGYGRERNDPTTEIPSFLRIAPDGVVIQKIYFADDSVQNPPSGVPAYQVLYASGSLLKTIHYQAGEEENPNKNTPAEISYYETGEVSEVRWFHQGEEVDSDFGMPARITYAKNGNVSGGYSPVHGKLDKKAVAALIAAAKKRSCLDIVTENQIVALFAKSPGSTIIPVSFKPTLAR